MKKSTIILLFSSLWFQFGCSDMLSTNVEAPSSQHAQEPEVRKINGIENYQIAANQLQLEIQETLKKHATTEDRLVMKKSAQDLAKKMPTPGLVVGEKAPDFELPNAFGNNIKLSDELKAGPVVLVFYRGSWCPYCNLHLHALQSITPQLKSYNARLIAITPQKPDESAKQLKKEGYPFEVLSDLDNQVMKDYNLYFDMSPDLLPVYQKFGIDLEAFNGKGRTGLPIPGTLVIDEQGIIRAIQADTDYKKRMEPAAILDAIKKIS